MGTAEFHHLVGKYLAARERGARASKRRSLLAAAYRRGVPIFTSSPGDSSIGMNLAALALEGQQARRSTLARREPDRPRSSTTPSSSGGTQRRLHPRRRHRPRTSCCRPSRRSRRCSGLDESGPRLLPAGHRRPPRHRRPLRRHPRRGDDLGQGRSREAARLGHLLPRLDDRPAAADRLRPGQGRPPPPQAPGRKAPRPRPPPARRLRREDEGAGGRGESGSSNAAPAP